MYGIGPPMCVASHAHPAGNTARPARAISRSRSCRRVIGQRVRPKVTFVVCRRAKCQPGQRDSRHCGAGAGRPGQQPDVMAARRDKGKVELGPARARQVHRVLRSPAGAGRAAEPYGRRQLLTGSSPLTVRRSRTGSLSSLGRAGISLPPVMRSSSCRASVIETLSMRSSARACRGAASLAAGFSAVAVRLTPPAPESDEVSGRPTWASIQSQRGPQSQSDHCLGSGAGSTSVCSASSRRSQVPSTCR